MFQKKQAIEQSKQKQEEDTGKSYGFVRSLTIGLASGISRMLTDSNNYQNILARTVKQIVGHVRTQYQ
jgi:hypothetical protein